MTAQMVPFRATLGWQVVMGKEAVDRADGPRHHAVRQEQIVCGFR